MRAVQAICLNVEHYFREEICPSVDRISHQNNPLGDIDQTEYCALDELFCKYNYYYALDMMHVYSSGTVNADDVTYGAVVHNVHGRKFLKGGY